MLAVEPVSGRRSSGRDDVQLLALDRDVNDAPVDGLCSSGLRASTPPVAANLAMAVGLSAYLPAARRRASMRRRSSARWVVTKPALTQTIVKTAAIKADAPLPCLPPCAL